MTTPLFTPPFVTPLEPRRLFSADLVATISVTPGAYDVGEQIPVIVRIRNVGTSTIMPSYNNVVSEPQQDHRRRRRHPDRLVQHQRGSITGRWRSNRFRRSSSAASPRASTSSAVRVDALQSVLESDERNTFFTDNADVKHPVAHPRARPDHRDGWRRCHHAGEREWPAVGHDQWRDADGHDTGLVVHRCRRGRRPGPSRYPSITIPLGITGNVGDDTLVGGERER
jgi:hypothetical protein